MLTPAVRTPCRHDFNELQKWANKKLNKKR
jgi:hypothetical protein